MILWKRELAHFCGGYTVMTLGLELGVPPIIVLAALGISLAWWERWNMKQGQTWRKLAFDVGAWALGACLAGWIGVR